MNHYFTNNDNLKSELRTLKYNFKDYNFTFYSDNGVFSKDKIDFGTKLLLETFLENTKENNQRILDVGCGYGILGIVISKVNDSFSVLIDVNKRCLHLSKRNVDLNKCNCEVIMSDCYENIKDVFDIVITNPPIRTGKENVKKILLNAPINKNGELWTVIRKDQGAKSFVKIMEAKYKVEIIKKYKGFYVIKAKNN